MRLTVPGPVGALEAVLTEPVHEPARFAVICHPHPLYGGTLDNKVVWTMARALEEQGIATLRFNFRGVGASAGSYGGGDGETEDARAMLAFGEARWPGARALLAGFSFGAYVALRLAGESTPARLITVAPPVGTAPAIERLRVEALPVPACPWLIIQGDADEVVDPRAVLAWAHGLEPKPTVIVVPGVGHFFHGALDILRDAVGDAVRSG
jgi:alpha/beta superfamily hydrolase